MIQEDPRMFVIDSTKIDSYQECPRAYLFRHILGWELELPNIHLTYGVAVHEAQELLLNEGYSEETAYAAFNRFVESFSAYTGVLGDTDERKNISNTLFLLQSYVRQYARDLQNFKVLHTEVAGVAALDFTGDRKLYFRSDAICYGEILGQHGYFSLEHKTGTRFSTQWTQQWMQKTQMGAYAWALSTMYPLNEILGVVVNGMFPRTPPRLKQDGSLYAADKDVKFFHRELVRKTPQQLDAWLNNTVMWYDDIIRDTMIALEVQEEPEHLPCFRKNTEACSKYSGCEYSSYCYAWTNPIRRAEPQIGFKQSLWDPRRLVEESKTKLTV